MLTSRLAVAAAGLPLLGLLVAAPERLFSAAIGLLLAAAAFEFVRAATPGNWPAAIVAAAAAALIVAAAGSIDGFDAWTLLPALALAFSIVFWRYDREPVPALWWLLGALYAGVLGAHFMLLRNLDDGQRWVVLLLAVTFATDTGAYAVGRLIGRHPMAPAISPGKTWEGAAGGLVAGAAVAAAAIVALAVAPGTAATIAIVATLPVAAQAGDLLESATKRRLGVKDMSTLLPGHGGLFDRLDSLLLAGPTLYWMVRWLAT